MRVDSSGAISVESVESLAALLNEALVQDHLDPLVFSIRCKTLFVLLLARLLFQFACFDVFRMMTIESLDEGAERGAQHKTNHECRLDDG